VAVNLVMAASSGVRLGGDSGIYIDGAQALLNGQPLTVRQPSYSGYIAFVTLFQAIGAGLAGLVIGQVAVAAVAAYVVALMARELGGALAAVIAVLLATLDFDTNRWHAYVLSDSLYASVLATVVWLVYRAGTSRRLLPYAIASIGLLAAASIRPEGWFVIPAAAMWWVSRIAVTRSGQWAGMAGVAAGCVLLVALMAPRLSGNAEAVGPGEMLAKGQTIWEFDGWRLAMPAAPPESSSLGSAGRAISYALEHPVHTAALMAARAGVHLAHVRPYFSTAHNAAIVVWLLPLYALALYGWWRVRAHDLARWTLMVLGTQTLVVVLTHADWDGRYLSHVLPIVYPFAACGLVVALNRIAPARFAELAHA
jgi:4-amino-4-deoxy-L-arabinose transferase-like glycosyltransferase